MDRTLLNLISLLLGSAGIFAVLTEYSVRELRASYWGENPFAIKAEAIKNQANRLFIGIAVVAALIQAAAEILGDHLPERAHSLGSYVLWFVLGIGLDYGIVRGLASLGRRMARAHWLPVIIESQREGFAQAREIIRNGGWRDDQLATKDSVPNPETYLQANWETVCRRITQLERLRDLPEVDEDLEFRVERLATHYATVPGRGGPQ